MSLANRKDGATGNPPDSFAPSAGRSQNAVGSRALPSKI
jgi:hypothetical protein